ncbi:hypothetical protein [Halosolutus halophilus]|uniref:hypothetical protein n=1 Tax=Halosolutus halophilus TaxID=1552990 RepID=UPI0022351399|nr:hypothetical protein [Halosolutus halophilus]
MSDCPTCGNHSWLCQQCKMEALESRHGVPSDHFETAADLNDQDNQDNLEYRCTSCGHEYTGSAPCPECSAHRRRYIGPLPGEESRTDGESEVATDGGRESEGREAFLTGNAHWCDLCKRPFDTITDLANHDCRPVRTDGGADQDDEYYVVDETRSAVVDGPFNAKELAAAAARDRGPEHIVATDGALELLALTSNTTIRWENDDVDLVTDGGRVQDHVSIENRPSIKSRLEEIDQLTESLLEDVQDDEDLAEPTRKAGERYLRGIRAQTESAMTVLVGPEAAFDDWPDDDHDDSAPVATTDGGQPIHRATCEDCAWSFENTDLVDVSDEMDRHARKEMHDVDLKRAVATDGGIDQPLTGTQRPWPANPDVTCHTCDATVPYNDMESEGWTYETLENGEQPAYCPDCSADMGTEQDGGESA